MKIERNECLGGGVGVLLFQPISRIRSRKNVINDIYVRFRSCFIYLLSFEFDEKRTKLLIILFHSPTPHVHSILNDISNYLFIHSLLSKEDDLYSSTNRIVLSFSNRTNNHREKEREREISLLLIIEYFI